MTGIDCRKLKKVSKEDVEYWVNFGYCHASHAALTTYDKEEWNKDHSMFIICRVLPLLDMPLKARRIIVEAYLSGAELWSDGSSVVPESLRYGNIKDFQGVAHDYVYYLNHWGLPDAYGHFWGLYEAHNMYRMAWVADGQILRGHLWFFGLSIGGWVVWRRYTEQEIKRCRQ